MRWNSRSGHGHCRTTGMHSPQDALIGREAASRALIDLVANLAWSERQHAGEAQLSRMRDEAMALLPRVERGDREATRRAMELINAAGDRTA